MRRLLFISLIIGLPFSGFAQKKVLFFQTDWGNTLNLKDFLIKVKTSGYDGIETWLPPIATAQETLMQELKNHDLKFILLCGSQNNLPFEEALSKYKEELKMAAKWNPILINSHTGSDFWTLEQNLALIKAAQDISRQTDIQIFHETHRGKFSFHLPGTLAMATAFPDLSLTLDISHWMMVHERLLKKDDPEIQKIIPHVKHIHARVGHEQGPQVNDPKAPEWKLALEAHLDIWQAIIEQFTGEFITVTTEFGPPNYMPTVPFTGVPLTDQWAANVFIMNELKAKITND